MGETNRADDVIRAMDRVNATSFEMQTEGIGHFSRSGGDLVFARINERENLMFFQAKLTQELKQQGFSPEERAFRPHLTLGREVRLMDGCRLEGFTLPRLLISATKISLMKSERIGGNLVYTEIHAKELN